LAPSRARWRSSEPSEQHWSHTLQSRNLEDMHLLRARARIGPKTPPAFAPVRVPRRKSPRCTFTASKFEAQQQQSGLVRTPGPGSATKTMPARSKVEQIRTTPIVKAGGFASSSTITRSRLLAHGFGSRSNGLTRRQVRRAAAPACSPTASKPASSQRRGCRSCRGGSAWSDTVAQERWTSKRA
jgi:hypothetical protein